MKLTNNITKSWAKITQNVMLNLSLIQDALWCVKTHSDICNSLLELICVSNMFLYFSFQDTQLPEAITLDSRVQLTNYLKHQKICEVLYQFITSYANYDHLRVQKCLKGLQNWLKNFQTKLSKMKPLISSNLDMILQQNLFDMHI